MRLNDPQIELVHDDPFMGYIETAPSTRPGSGETISSHRRRAPLDSIADGEDTPSVVDDADEDVDVGEETSRHPSPPPPPPPAPASASSVSVSASNNNDGATVSDQPIVIVLLVE